MVALHTLRRLSPAEARRAPLVADAFVTNLPEHTRLVVNLQLANAFLPKRPCRYETLGFFAAQLVRGDNLVSWDIKSAYHHLPLHKDVCKYLVFRLGARFYEPHTLLFGLSLAPWAWTKLFRPVLAALRAAGFRSLGYIDDFAAAPPRVCAADPGGDHSGTCRGPEEIRVVWPPGSVREALPGGHAASSALGLRRRHDAGTALSDARSPGQGAPGCPPAAAPRRAPRPLCPVLAPAPLLRACRLHTPGRPPRALPPTRALRRHAWRGAPVGHTHGRRSSARPGLVAGPRRRRVGRAGALERAAAGGGDFRRQPTWLGLHVPAPGPRTRLLPP